VGYTITVDWETEVVIGAIVYVPALGQTYVVVSMMEVTVPPTGETVA
jgi:hypothetical protein